MLSWQHVNGEEWEEEDNDDVVVPAVMWATQPALLSLQGHQGIRVLRFPARTTNTAGLSANEDFWVSK